MTGDRPAERQFAQQLVETRSNWFVERQEPSRRLPLLAVLPVERVEHLLDRSGRAEQLIEGIGHALEVHAKLTSSSVLSPFVMSAQGITTQFSLRRERCYACPSAPRAELTTTTQAHRPTKRATVAPNQPH